MATADNTNDNVAKTALMNPLLLLQNSTILIKAFTPLHITNSYL